MCPLAKIHSYLYNLKSYGRLAQLARASALHAEGRGFEPLSAHQIIIPTFTVGILICVHFGPQTPDAKGRG